MYFRHHANCSGQHPRRSWWIREWCDLSAMEGCPALEEAFLVDLACRIACRSVGVLFFEAPFWTPILYSLHITVT